MVSDNHMQRGSALRIAVGTLLIFLVLGGASAQEYVYYLPHVTTTAEFYPANDAGNFNSYYISNHGQGTLEIGASIRSNKPLQPVIEMWENDYGTYDHTFLQESLLPVSEWGSEFIIPTDITYVYIFAKDQTQVTIARPGQSSISQTISARKNLKVSSVQAGTSISANNPVEVLAVNIQTDQNYPWSYNVLPITKLGTEYYYDMSYK